MGFVQVVLRFCTAGFVNKGASYNRGDVAKYFKEEGFGKLKARDEMSPIYRVMGQGYKLNLPITRVIPKPTLNKRLTNVRRIMLTHLRPLFNVIQQIPVTL